MPFGASIVDYKAGAQAMQDIISMPAETARKQAESRIAVAKAPYEEAKYKGLMEYMQGPKPAEIGAEQYAMMSDAQKIQAEEGILQQEEQRIRKSGMDPLDMKNALTPLEGRRNKIDTLKVKVQQQMAKHLDQDVAAVSGVNDDASLAGYRGWKQQQAEAQAEEAIREGKLPPETRQAFINDQMKGIPTRWDKTAERWKDAHIAEGSSSKEFFQLQAEQAKTKQLQIAASKAEAEHRDRERKFERLIVSGNATAIRSALPTISRDKADSSNRLKEIDNNLKNLHKDITGSDLKPAVIPKTIPNPEYGFWSSGVPKTIPNPEYGEINTQIKELNTEREKEQERHKQYTLQEQTVMEQLGVKSIPKEPPPKESLGSSSKAKSEPTHDLTEAGVLAELKTHFPNKSTEELRQMAIEAGDIKETSAKKPILKGDTKKEKEIISAAQAPELTPLQKSALIDEAVLESGKAFGKKLAAFFEYR